MTENFPQTEVIFQITDLGSSEIIKQDKCQLNYMQAYNF